MVVSGDAFNVVTGLPVVVPITLAAADRRTRGFAVSLDACGTRVLGIVHCNQPRVVDLRAVLAESIERAPGAVVDEVLARVTAIFE